MPAGPVTATVTPSGASARSSSRRSLDPVADVVGVAGLDRDDREDRGAVLRRDQLVVGLALDRASAST